MKNTLFKINIISFLFFVIIFLSSETGFSRPGGGHSYKSNNSSSSSSSSSKSNYEYNNSEDNVDYDNMEYVDFDNDDEPTSLWIDIVMWIIILFIPVVLGILAIGFTFLFIVKKIQKSKSVQSSPTTKNITRRNIKIEKELRELKKTDANFSKTLFVDFVASLYTSFYSWQGKKKFINLSPFFDTSNIHFSVAKDNMSNDFSEIILGGINILKINANSKSQSILVEINANYTNKTIIVGEKTTLRYITTDKWLFKRKKGVISSEPKENKELSCPSCGANAKFTDVGKCKSCGTIVTSGEMQWAVYSIAKDNRSFKTNNLIHYEQESGTKLPTVIHPFLEDNKVKFAKNHNINWGNWSVKFQKEVVNDFFVNLYKAWSINKLDTVRNLLSDRLYESWMFWIANYKKEGLINKLDNVIVKNTEFVNIEFDKFYETAIVRIHASCYDYVENKKGNLVGGSNKKNRSFSEYWTFIRRTGVEKDSYDYNTCPNCGASIDKMGQSGICGYCNSKISNGDFSWVLTSITQDEEYKG